MVRARQRGFVFGAGVLRVLAVVAVMAAVSSQAQAQFIDPACDTSGNPVTVSANCENFLLNSAKSAVTIGPSARVSAFATQDDAVLINPGGSVTGTFLNQGTLTYGIMRNAIVNRGTISTLINQSQIIGSENSLVNRGTISTLVNQGSILTSGTSSSYGALANLGEIGTLENSGTIAATGGLAFEAPMRSCSAGISGPCRIPA